MDNLELEILKLRDRLNKAVVFEVAPDISIGISVDDNLWRIRRDINDDFVFLNKDGVWENPPEIEDIMFANRTGYDFIDDAFEAFEQYNGHYDDMIFNMASNGLMN